MKTILLTTITLFFCFSANASTYQNKVSNQNKLSAICFSYVTSAGTLKQICF